MLTPRRHGRDRERGQVLILALAFIAFFAVVIAAVLTYADATALQHVHTESTAASDASTEGGADFAVSNAVVAPGCTAGATGTLTMQSGVTVAYGTSGCVANGTRISQSGSGLPDQCLLCLLGTGTSLSTNTHAALDVAGRIAIDGSAVTQASVTSTAPGTGYVGYYGASWSASATVTPSPAKMSSPVPDPLASTPIPSSGSGSACSASTGGSGTLSPGVYCSITLSGNSTYTLSPGTYYILGGFSVSGRASLSGSGVLLYLGCTNDAVHLAACSAGQSGGYLDASGNGSINLSPPTSGSWSGMLLMFDRDDAGSTGTSCGSTHVALCISGNGATIGGTVYGASAPISIAGNGSAAVTGLLVASSLTMNVSANVQFPLTLNGPGVTAGYCWVYDDVVTGAGGSAALLGSYSAGASTLTLTVISGSLAPAPGQLVALLGGSSADQVDTVASVSGSAPTFTVTFTQSVSATGYTGAVWPATGHVVLESNCNPIGGSASIDFNYKP